MGFSESVMYLFLVLLLCVCTARGASNDSSMHIVDTENCIPGSGYVTLNLGSNVSDTGNFGSGFSDFWNFSVSTENQATQFDIQIGGRNFQFDCQKDPNVPCNLQFHLLPASESLTVKFSDRRGTGEPKQSIKGTVCKSPSVFTQAFFSRLQGVLLIRQYSDLADSNSQFVKLTDANGVHPNQEYFLVICNGSTCKNVSNSEEFCTNRPLGDQETWPQVCVINVNRSNPETFKNSSAIVYQLIPLDPVDRKEGEAFANLTRKLFPSTMKISSLDPCLFAPVFPVVPCETNGSTSFLTKLDMTGMQLSGTISEDLVDFEQLTTLVLAINKIVIEDTGLNAGIKNHRSLEVFDLRSNSLKQFNLSVRMPHLRSLDLSDNSFHEGNQTAFRDSLIAWANLTSLQNLSLRGNNLALDFDATFGGFTNLSYLDIRNNSFSGPFTKWEQFANTTICVLPGNSSLPDLCPDHTDGCCTPRKPSSESRSRAVPLWMVIVLPITSIAILTCVCTTSVWWICLRRGEAHLPQKKPRCVRGERTLPQERIGFLRKSNLHEGETLWRFTLQEVEVATNSFAAYRLLGKGSFGDVVSGSLINIAVAIKIRAKTATTPILQNFQKDVENLAKLSHGNLAKLLGYLDTEAYQALVLERFENGSLQDHLHGDKAGGDTVLLSWARRLKVLSGAAYAIEYLHGEDSIFKRSVCGMIHCNIKSSNILIEKNFEAKVTDFGLYTPRLFNDKSHSDLQLFFEGYLDPDYMNSETKMELDRKSDVYSFGVVLLEALTGKPPIVSPKPGETPLHLRELVMEAKDSGKTKDVIDARLEAGGLMPFYMDSVMMVVDLALRCTELDPNRRPSMRQVKQKLENAQRSESVSSKKKLVIELQSSMDPRAGSFKEVSSSSVKGSVANGSFSLTSPIGRSLT